MHTAKPFAATMAFFEMLESDHTLPCTPTVTQLRAWCALALKKLRAGRGENLTVAELVASRVVVRSLIEDPDQAQSDIILATLCMTRLPMLSPDQIREAMRLDTEAFYHQLRHRAEEMDAAASIGQGTLPS